VPFLYWELILFNQGIPFLFHWFDQAPRSGGSIKAGPATCQQQLQLRKKHIAGLSQAL
jgi:hypothetical protein